MLFFGLFASLLPSLRILPVKFLNTFIPLEIVEAISTIQYLIWIGTGTPLVLASVAVLLSHLTSHVQEY